MKKQYTHEKGDWKMALLKCSICGLQKEKGIGSNLCPMCGGEFLPEEKGYQKIKK